MILTEFHLILSYPQNKSKMNLTSEHELEVKYK